MQQYRPSGFKMLPPVIKNLLIINVLFYLATLALGSSFNIDLVKYLGLHYPAAADFKIWQIVSYMFMHSPTSFMHILFNMFALWMFGNTLENVWGSKRFLIYYMVTGIGAGLVYILWVYVEINPTISSINSIIQDPSIESLMAFNQGHPFRISEYSGDIWNEYVRFKQTLALAETNPNNHQALQAIVGFLSDYKYYFLNQQIVIGASGAVFGILLAFGMMFPNTLIYVYFAIPIKAKYFVMIYGAIEVYMGFANSQSDNVAHFAHLGGMLFGYLLIRLWKAKDRSY